MGEANYYLRAMFPDARVAKKVEPLFRELLRSIAEDEPQARKTLRLPQPEGLPDLGEWDEDSDIIREGRELRLTGISAWHLTDWEPLADWLRKQGAKEVRWTSDEYGDLWTQVGELGYR